MKILYPVFREIPNSRQTSLIDSPSSKRATNCRRSSITEHSFHGIDTSPVSRESVTYVSGTFWNLCLGPLKRVAAMQPFCFVALREFCVRKTKIVVPTAMWAVRDQSAGHFADPPHLSLRRVGSVAGSFD